MTGRCSRMAQSPACQYARTHGTRACDVMISRFVEVAPDADIFDVIPLVEKHDVRRVLVIDDKRLFGIPTRSDILRGLLASRLKLGRGFERPRHRADGARRGCRRDVGEAYAQRPHGEGTPSSASGERPVSCTESGGTTFPWVGYQRPLRDDKVCRRMSGHRDGGTTACDSHSHATAGGGTPVWIIPAHGTHRHHDPNRSKAVYLAALLAGVIRSPFNPGRCRQARRRHGSRRWRVARSAAGNARAVSRSAAQSSPLPWQNFSPPFSGLVGVNLLPAGCHHLSPMLLSLLFARMLPSGSGGRLASDQQDQRKCSRPAPLRRSGSLDLSPRLSAI
jgi:hypothetical protein